MPGMLGKFKSVSESATVTKSDVAIVPMSPVLLWCHMPMAKYVVAAPKSDV